MHNAEGATERRAHILQSATTVLARQGIQALSFETVAAEAGMSRQLVRYYFADLDTMIADLCDHLAGAYRDILISGIVQIDQVKRLPLFLDFFFGLSDDYHMPKDLEVYDALVAYAVGSEALRTRMCTQYKTLGDVFTHDLAVAHPELDGRACEELSYLIVSMMHAHWSFVSSLGFSRDHARVTRRAIDRVIAAYCADTSPTPGLDRVWAQAS